MKKIALAVMLVALSGCNENPYEVARVDSGSLHFTFPGGGGQPPTEFDAEGSAELTRLGNFRLGDWAYSERGPQDPMPIIVHASMTSDPRYHYATMQIPREVAAGTDLRGDPQCEASAADCARLGVLFHTFTNGGATTACFMTSGTVRIVSRSEGRMRGTFQAVLSCTPAPSGMPENATVTDGSFDVEIIDYDDYSR
jgi:hypothetical protein